jgi:hypothetical protein
MDFRSVRCTGAAYPALLARPHHLRSSLSPLSTDVKRGAELIAGWRRAPTLPVRVSPFALALHLRVRGLCSILQLPNPTSVG